MIAGRKLSQPVVVQVLVHHQWAVDARLGRVEGTADPPDTFTGSDMNTRYWRLPLLVLLASTACSGPVEQHARKTEAGRYYGGVFNANETEGIRSLFPLSLTQASSLRIAA